MYTQQFINSVKKIFLWYLYGRFREQIFKESTILDENIETFIKIRQIWKHTPSSVNRLTAVRKFLTVPENRLINPSPAAGKRNKQAKKKKDVKNYERRRYTSKS